MRISSFSIRHPAVIIILGVAVLVFGLLSLSTLNQEFLPNVSLPSVIVIAQYPGVEADLVEQEVTSILEDAFVTLQGLQKIDSQSSNSVSMITLEFSDDIDVYDQLPEVRAAISRIEGQLPDDLESSPYAFVGGAGLLTVFSFAVISDRDPDRLYQLVEQEIIPLVSRIPGTAVVSSYGGRERQVRIDLDVDRLQNLRISVMEVFQALQASNVSLPAGTLSYRDDLLYISVKGEYDTLDEIRDLVIGYRGQSYISLSDVADISLIYPEEDLYIEADGQRAIVVDVTKREDGNTIEIARSINGLLDRYAAIYEGVITFEVIQDDSSMIATSLQTTVRSGLLGAAMAVLVIFLFLGNIRATLIIGISIPLSIVTAFIGMRLAGQTVNILSLSGLIVALGMVVDSSIVILENIFRYEHEGYSPSEAAHTGSDEVGGAVFASGATTISVFIPLLFLSGIIGIIMTDVSLTIIFALGASLLVALVIIPFLATHLHIEGLFEDERTPEQGGRLRRRSRRIGQGLTGLERIYKRGLYWSLSHRFFVVLLSVIILASSVLAVGRLGVVFIPSSDSSEIYIYMTFPQGYSIDDSHGRVLDAQALAAELIPEMEHSVWFTGYADEYSRSRPSDNSAYAKLLLVDSTERERGIKEIILALQQSLISTIPDIDAVVEQGGFDKLLAIATGGSGFQVELSGPDLNLLYEKAIEVRDVLQDDPDIYKARVDVKRDQETLITELALDHMGRAGISSYEAALTARILFNGIEVGSYTGDAEDDHPIMLTSGIAREPLDLNTLERISLPTQSGSSVSFENISETRLSAQVSTIHHKDRLKTITVSGYGPSDDTTAIRARMQEYLPTAVTGTEISWNIAGSSTLLTDSFTTLLLVLGISLFLVYTVMVLQFERFTHPLIIMTSIPLCIIGVIIGLLVFGSDISLIAFLGLIALGGLVVNNAIVLIDRMNHGTETRLEDLVVNGAGTRLRPILMTTLTTFFGVMPMTLSAGGGSEIYAPLGQAIAGGLISSTLITLFLIPVLYYTVEKDRLEEKEEAHEQIL